MIRIEFVQGKRKSGKSSYIIDSMKKHIDSKEICYFLVPDQSTLETESKIINEISSNGLLDVQVVSFKKLGNILLKNTDMRSKSFLNEQGQLLILNRIINELDNQLVYFKKAKASTLEEINKVINDLRDIETADLDNKKLGDKPELISKLKELELIKEKYKDYLGTGYIDDISFNEMLLEVISQSTLIKEAHFYVDDFYTFSNQQLDIIKRLMSTCKSLAIANIVDPNYREFNQLSYNVYLMLKNYADKENLSNKTILLNKQYYKSKELEHLENILRSNKMIKYEDELRDISIINFTNIDSEVKNLFESIIKLVDQGYKYKDIKVICNNLDAYRNYFKLYRKLYEVPLFIDEKVFIHNHPIARLILSIINLKNDTKTEDILNALKTGYLDFSIHEIELLEKYVLENGINYNKWFRNFEDNNEVEAIRFKVQKFIDSLRKIVIGENVKDKITTIYTFITDLKVYDHLMENIDSFKLKENYKNVYIHTQFWNKLLEIFDQMVSFLGEKNISFNELNSLIKNCLEREFLSILPINNNEVIILNSQAAFKETAKVLFVIGANEGYLPEKISQEPLFPLDESLILEELLNWKKDDLSKQIIRNLELYFTLSMADEKLILSYSLSDSIGDGIKPAYIIQSIKKVFPKYKKIELNFDNTNYFYSKGISLINLIKKSKSGKVDISKNNYENIYSEYGEFLDKLFEYNRIESNEGLINADSVRKILFHNNEPFFTISKLEEYGKCPYSFYIKYGLKPVEEKEYEIKSMDIGNIYHNVLEQIGKNNWYLGKDIDIDKSVDEMFLNVYQENKLNKFDSHQLQYRLNRIKEEGLNLIKNFINDIENSTYKPTYYELEFGKNKTFPEFRLELDNGISFYLEGKVDRVDILKEVEKDYLRIIDYKLKGKKMEYKKFRDGIAFQLFVYLMALSSNKNYLPGGVLYSRLIEDENYDRHTGLLVGDEPDIATIPDGFSKNNIITFEDYNLITKHIENNIKEHVTNILHGDFEVAPYYYKNDERGCKYCKFINICKNKKANRMLSNKNCDKKTFIEELKLKYAKLD